MHLREPNSLVGEWMDASWQLAIGVAGVILIILGLKRDDIIRPVFLIAGLALVVLGFGGQLFGLKL